MQPVSKSLRGAKIWIEEDTGITAVAAIVSPGGGESGALDGLIISKSDLAQSFERVLCLTLQEMHLSIISFSFEPPRHKRFGPAIRWSRRVEGVLDPMYPSKLSSLEDL